MNDSNDSIVVVAWECGGGGGYSGGDGGVGVIMVMLAVKYCRCV